MLFATYWIIHNVWNEGNWHNKGILKSEKKKKRNQKTSFLQVVRKGLFGIMFGACYFSTKSICLKSWENVNGNLWFF